MDQDCRVVVTGMGTVTPLGLDCTTTFDALLAGTSGVAAVSAFDPARLACRIAGEVKGFDPSACIDAKTARRLGRNTQFALAATREALDQAALDPAKVDVQRVASLVSTGIADYPLIEAEMTRFLERGPGRTYPFSVPRIATSMASAHISMEYGFQGPCYGVTSACATSSHSIATGWMLLKSGLADVVIVGGTESAICETFFESYVAMRALSERNDAPERAMRPFDSGRDGFVIAEGCAVLVMETLDHARARGAPLQAELAGVGMSSDAFHITAPHAEGRGAVLAMQSALACAGLEPGQVDYINAHGTSTPLNDPMETLAIKRVFGEQAAGVPVSSIKSMIGHTIGAAGAIEAMVSILALQRGAIPPTINLDDPDPACDLDYVPHRARFRELDVVMSNSFAFGGQNCVLVLRKFAA